MKCLIKIHYYSRDYTMILPTTQTSTVSLLCLVLLHLFGQVALTITISTVNNFDHRAMKLKRNEKRNQMSLGLEDG